MESQLQLVFDYVASGLAILPAKKNEKRPAIGKWRDYATGEAQVNREIVTHWDWSDAVCVVCGKPSGNLTIIDFDCKGIFFDRWRQNVYQAGGGNILCQLVIERTPSGGFHVAFRSESPAEGNQKLAFCAAQNATAIETRGQGGICLIDPSPDYNAFQGRWTQLPTLTRGDYNLLIRCAEELNESPQTISAIATTAPISALITTPPPQQPAAKRPWCREDIADRLRQERKAREFLSDNGWQFLRSADNEEYWQRPGKDKQQTGGTLTIDTQCFHCFTSNGAPLEADRGYTPLTLYAAFYCAGNLSEASKYWASHYGVNLTQQEDNPLCKTTVLPEAFVATKKVQVEPDEPFPRDVLRAPGLIAQISEYTNNNCYKLQPVLAFAGAFSFLSFATGRRVKYVSGVRPNAYCIAASGAGTGKDAARQTNKKLLEIYDDCSVDPEVYESRQAFINMLIVQKQLLNQVDEFGQFFAAMTDARGNQNVRQILDEWLKVYSSANSDSYLPRIVAADADKIYKNKIITQPHLTIYGTTTPGELFKAITVDSIKKGFIPRCFIFEGDNKALFRPLLTEEQPIPTAIAETVRAWRIFREPPKVGIPDPFVVRPDADAKKLFDYFVKRNNDKHLQIVDDDSAAIVNGRAIEKACKAAIIFAASKFGPNENTLVVDSQCAELAIKLVEWSTNRFFKWQDRYLAESQNDRDVKDVYNWVLDKNGKFTLSEYTRRFQRLPKKQREEVLETLVTQGRIIANKEKERKKGRSKTNYTTEITR